jgi:hypothetical protein
MALYDVAHAIDNIIVECEQYCHIYSNLMYVVGMCSECNICCQARQKFIISSDTIEIIFNGISTEINHKVNPTLFDTHFIKTDKGALLSALDTYKTKMGHNHLIQDSHDHWIEYMCDELPYALKSIKKKVLNTSPDMDDIKNDIMWLIDDIAITASNHLGTHFNDLVANTVQALYTYIFEPRGKFTKAANKYSKY